MLAAEILEIMDDRMTNWGKAEIKEEKIHMMK